ncbi:hypothetical protein RQP46_001548 [Phenoliferia psychrophenolica]
MVTRLPSELLAHVLHLSNEGESPKQAQRNLLTFRRIARPFFLAAENVSSFYVEDTQATSLLLKLSREKDGARSVIRHLAFKIATPSGGRLLEKLFELSPHLIALDVHFHGQDLVDPATLTALEVALGSLTKLRDVRLSGFGVPGETVLRLLQPLATLEALDLTGLHYSCSDVNEALLRRLSLPKLRVIRFEAGGLHTSRTSNMDPTAVLIKLASAAPDLRTLDLTTVSYAGGMGIIKAITPTVANLATFSWRLTSHPSHAVGVAILDDHDTLLHFFRAMKSLQSIDLRMWCIVTDWESWSAWALPGLPIDYTLFDALATLPNLHTIKLEARTKSFDQTQIDLFIQNCPTLRVIWLRASLSSGRDWRRRGLVTAAGTASTRAQVDWTNEGRLK